MPSGMQGKPNELQIFISAANSRVLRNHIAKHLTYKITFYDNTAPLT